MEKEWKEYLTGRGSGSGKYHLFNASKGRRSVEVQDLPENIGTIRILIREMDCTTTWQIDECHAHCLWSALSQLAEVKKWQNELELKS